MREKATIYDYTRMCKVFEGCKGCPLDKDLCHINLLNKKKLDRANETIIKWCKEHPAKTRQDTFLEMFPNASLQVDGVLKIQPCHINESVECVRDNDCNICRSKYWLAEVEE